MTTFRLAPAAALMLAPFITGFALAQKPAEPPKAAAKPAAKAAPKSESTCKYDKSAPVINVQLTTNLGKIKLALNNEKAPISTENFVKYVSSGFYAGTVFHRVIDGFMIQGGGYDKALKERPTQPPIKNEAANGLKNDAYTIAMARTNVVDSATSQFFINVVNNDGLNHRGPDNFGYAAFGTVTEGKEVVDKIKAVKIAPRNPMMTHAPVEDVVIEKAECL
jgi:peptidyl-prolyl cis-trans isomerase B (cyclophilin B)